MENIVAIILILIMIIFDTRSVGKFINITRPLKDGLNYSGKSVSKELFNMKSTLLNPKVVINKLNKSNLWVYNNNTVSSRHWKTFYSRRYLQPTSSLINLCIKSIIKQSLMNTSIYWWLKDFKLKRWLITLSLVRNQLILFLRKKDGIKCTLNSN